MEDRLSAYMSHIMTIIIDIGISYTLKFDFLIFNE